MTEQEQAQALARWLDQPAGTPPPEGLDADVIESVFALHPDAAPALSLTADDILAGMDGFGVPEETSSPDAAVLPPTPVQAAPPWWRAANRVAGIGVLLATAATLMLVLVPVTLDQAESPVVGGGDVADRSAATRPDPIVSVAEPAAEAEMVASAKDADVSAGEVAGEPADAMNADPAAGDAVADAGDVVRNEYRMEQQQRFGEGNLIPELDAYENNLDGVAGLDEIAAAPASRARTESAPQGLQEGLAAAAAEQGVATKTLADVSSGRSGAVPTDLDDSWRGSVDAGTLADIDRALGMAEAEARAGRPAQAAEAVIGHLGYPDLAGQYIAARAAQWYLDAGDVAAATSAIQRGLALSSDNTAFRAWLLVLQGDVLQRRGNPQGAEALWRQAEALNRLR